MSRIDRIAAAVTRDQHGLGTTAAFVAAGVSERSVRRRVADKEWLRRRDGCIDTRTHPDTWEKRATCLLLSAGDGAMLSHDTAAHLHGLLDSPRPDRIDVTVPRGRHAEVGGVRLHTTVRSLPHERVALLGLPTTSLGRTVVDSSPRRRDDWLQISFGDGLRRGVTTPLEIFESVVLRPGAVDTSRLLRALGGVPGGLEAADSVLEVIGVVRMAQMGLPTPVLQHEVVLEGHRNLLDAAWLGRRVNAELDGNRTHGTDIRRERDELRDARLQRHGWTVVRITFADAMAGAASPPFQRLAALLL